MTRLFLRKTPIEKLQENPRLPYFQLVIPPDVEGGEWVTVGALWKSATGTGYSGKTNDGVIIDYSAVNPRPSQNVLGSNTAYNPQPQQAYNPQPQQAYNPQPQQAPVSPTPAQQAPAPSQQPSIHQEFPIEEINPDDIPF